MPVVHLAFRPYAEASEEPNVVVDGSPTANTVLTLSHWPGSSDLPVDLQADLSAQMAFRYLDRAEPLHGDAAVVSNNHFDQDGLVSIFALAHPEEAMPRRPFLEDLAAAGDFATFRDRDAARASMVVSAFTDADRSPLGRSPAESDDRTAWLYTEALGRLIELVDDVERYRHLWAAEDAHLAESEAAIADGTVRIAERPDVDLAVVTVPEGRHWWGHRFGGRRYDGVHPMALHNVTSCTALLLVDGSYRFTYRYETWVQYRSRPVRPRVDLGPLAAALTAADTVGWVNDPIGELTPELAPVGAAGSSLAPDIVTEMIAQHLRTSPAAFDPFTTGAR
ncbi:DUF6687 family protein [Iamia sp.]|uniref:DUF6687 family protein n=1 Tax=Iamia sp. TaxID=2722710 RepID=UPI002C5D3486|nr:DUF6687 family protein [Iamia sp.]HXH59556.1 DUF6687 family protein [Iamia sp.]